MFAVGSHQTAVVLLLALAFGAAPSRGQDAPSAVVRILQIDSRRNFPDAAAPRSIALACTNSPEALPEYFHRKGLPFDPGLVYALPEFAACHIYYEPSLPGFRAARDDSPIAGLYVAVDPLNFFADADFSGSSLDIAKTVLGKLPRPVDVHINIAGGFDKSLWQPSAAYHFGGAPHRIEFFHSGLVLAHPWTQDHLKSGAVNGRRRLLIPRRLFEGKEPDGEAYKALLQRMKAPDVVQSKLSWEGGDIQFVASPQDPSKTILAHGAAGRYYWGLDITPQEYSYILKSEFGADEVLDLSRLGPHADYLVGFLPADHTALVAQLVHGNAALARAAAFELEQSFGNTVPPPVRRLAVAAIDWEAGADNNLLHAISSARDFLNGLPAQPEFEPSEDADRYIAAHCPGWPQDCLDAAGAPRMMQTDRELLRRTSSYVAEQTTSAILRPILLDLIEAQVSRPAWKESLLDDAAKKLEGWGFRVVRVPLLATKTFHDGWPGVSYINMLAFDRRLFVPTLGFGDVEERILSQLRDDLGGRYDIVPVNSRASLLRHGGVHCVFGIIR